MPKGAPGDKNLGSKTPTAVPLPVSPNSDIGTLTSEELASPSTPIVSYLEFKRLSTLANISKLFMGFQEVLALKTIYGLSGLGDLVVTCYGKYSRNRRLGILLSEGKTLNEAKDLIGMVSEGINTSKILNKIIVNNNLEMPICSEIFNILFKGCNPKYSLHRLMMRTLKVEN